MNSSTANNNLLFSTITKKSDKANEKLGQSEQLRLVQQFKDLIKARGSEVSQIVDPMSKFTVDTKQMRDKLVIGDTSNVSFSLFKKGKRSNKIISRNATLTKNDILHFSQNIHNKVYNTPSQITPETYEQYQQRMQAATTKAEKKKILPWPPKTPGKADFRISFIRHVNPNANAGNAPAVPDSAFYFDTKEEFEKARNYLKFIELLELNQNKNRPDLLLQNLLKAFRGQLAAKLRKKIGARAKAIRDDMKSYKMRLVDKNKFLENVNKQPLRILAQKWLKVANDRESYQKNRERYLKEREENIYNTVRRSSLIQTLNSYLVGALLEGWKIEAEARIQTYREDIGIFVPIIEVANSIIQPSLKIEISVAKEYPDDFFLNDTIIHEKSFDRTVLHRLDCRIKGPKGPNVYTWKLMPRKIPNKNDLERSDISNGEGNDDILYLHFHNFILEFLDAVEIKFLLFDQSDSLKAYHYVTLRNLYGISKKGNNIWLCMDVNHRDTANPSLLNLKVFSKKVEKNHPAVHFNIKKAGSSDEDRIEDPFFNYSFDMPSITPKHEKILELLPKSWNIIDDKTKELKRSEQYGPFVREVKSKLFRHYYERTTRQVARLKRSAHLWAELQDELTSYAPKNRTGDASQLYVDDQYIRNLAGLQKPMIDERNRDEHDMSQEINNEFNGIVSYLFKRDKWESKDDWRKFYVKLGVLCRKGLPAQHRLNIWAEMSRVVYFVNLTQSEHKKQRGVKNYQQVYFEPEQGRDERSHTIDNIYKKSKTVYEDLKKDAEKEFIYLYQELEDDLDFLREHFDTVEKQKIPYERQIRSICRTFIFWSKLFSDPATEEKIRYFVTYSRSILMLCYGLVTCQTCSYLEKEVLVEEEQVFWILISLSTYIISSYFETNESSVSVDKLTFKEGDNMDRKKNKLTNSALRCNQMKGVKGDLLVLKILLKEYESEIYYKFEELGLPLEYYFGDHMLTLFVNLFNPGLTFRIWDVLFFEGSSANQVSCNRMIVCFLYVLLKECKGMILRAKKASDINLAINTYAKFQTNYGRFIKEGYIVCSKYFVQALPKEDSVLDKISYIKYALFSPEYNKFDNKIRDIEKKIEANYFTYTFQQNMALFALTNHQYQYKAKGEPETLSYAVLATIIKDFQTTFGVTSLENKPTTSNNREEDYETTDKSGKKKYKLFQDVNLDSRKLLKGKIAHIHYRVHKIVTYWPDIQDLSLGVVYGKEKQKKRDFQTLEVDFDGTFSIGSNREVPRYLNVELYNERDPTNPQKIKYISIDLKRIPFNLPTKLNLKFKEENPNIFNDNYIVSEAELTILLEGTQATPEESLPNEGINFTVPELENPAYDNFRKAHLFELQTAPKLDEEGEVVRRTHRAAPSFTRNRHAWKENFALNYEEFLHVMKKIAPFWVNVADLSKIYDTIAKANRNSTFYITDFFILLILFGKFTSIQKFGLIFDLFTGFDDTYTDRTREMSSDVLKGLCAYIYDLFMIYMPYNELENIIDLTIYGNVSVIKKVVIDGQINPRNEKLRQLLNRLSNYIHSNFNTRDLHFPQEQILDLLSDFYNKETPLEDPTRNYPSHRVEVTYLKNGMSHKMRFDVDEGWKIIEDTRDGRKSTKTGIRLLSNYKNVMSLENTPKIFGRNEFLAVMQKLPMVNYLCSLEHTEISNTLSYLQTIKFVVNMEGETLLTAIPSYEIASNEVLGGSEDGIHPKKKKFSTLLREWDDVVRGSAVRFGSNSNLRASKGNLKGSKVRDAQKIPVSKLNIFFSHNQLVQSLKREIIRTVSGSIEKSVTNSEVFSPYVFNKQLWHLDFNVNISITGKKEMIINDKKKSPFKTLMEVLERSLYGDREIETVEIIYDLKNTVISDPLIESFNQLALYRFVDSSSDWLPCKIKYQYEYTQQGDKQMYKNKSIDGFGVVFAKFPEETVLKKATEVAIINELDMAELERKKIDREITRALNNDQALKAYSPDRLQMNRGGNQEVTKSSRPKNLQQKPIDHDDDDYFFSSQPAIQRNTGLGSGQKVKSGAPTHNDGLRGNDSYEDMFSGKLKVTH